MSEKRESHAPTTLPDWLAGARRRGPLSRLPDHLVEAIIRGGHRVTYRAGAILPEPEMGPWAAVVLGGSVRVYLPAPDGGQITLLYLKPGDTIGTFVADQPSLARSLLAVDSAELFHFDVGRFVSLTQSEPQVAWEMLMEAARILRVTHRSYGIRTFGSIRLRVANAILDRALASGPVAAGAIVSGTQHELANAAGTVREVAAGALQAMKRDGVVEIRRGCVVILDPRRLAAEADGGFGFGSPY
jgi:CRP/FNR family transcriptional regulator, cyclic AMP receptor protein